MAPASTRMGKALSYLDLTCSILFDELPEKQALACHPAPPRRLDRETQLGFLTVLTHTRCVSLAAQRVGMTRESAYRLRSRDPHGLFSHIWKKAMALPSWLPASGEVDRGHARITLNRLATEDDAAPQNSATRSSS